jgi:diguanylate cyclase (GGDEF)-like protein/PAS domain S-box-containing protein
LETDENQQIELHLEKNGEDAYLQATICPFATGSVLFVGTDISQIRKAEQELDNRVRFYTFLINNSSDMITVINREGTIVFESPALQSVLGLQASEVVGAAFMRLIHDEDWDAVQRTIDETPPGKTSISFEFRRRNRQGEWICLEGLATNLLKDKAIQGIIINARNIDERKKFESERKEHLFRDPLTGLANRTRLLDRLSQSIDHCRREPEFQFALILVNLDRFKAINKTLGWELGDKFLLLVARMLKTEYREIDTIARIGSDEFGLLINGFQDARAPIRAAERLKEKIGRTLVLEGMEIPFSASMGIVYGSGRCSGPEHLISDAATAMYQAKADPTADYCIFHSKMHMQTLNLLQMENDLRKALDRRELVLHYQPILDLFSRRIVSLEALIRWRHPRKGLIYPDQFIPLAEETGLILPIGRYVLEQACREILSLNRRLPSACMLSVNLSARQLADPNLFAYITSLLDRLGFPSRLLQLEMTESALLRREEKTAAVFGKFKEAGLKLAIDDFGTGYSSLKYLHDFPFDTLKIDRSFIGSLNGKVNKNEKIIQSIMTLASNLDMQVIAEGIESQCHLKRIKTLACRYGQGFYFAGPMPIDELIRISFPTLHSSVPAASFECLAR